MDNRDTGQRGYFCSYHVTHRASVDQPAWRQAGLSTRANRATRYRCRTRGRRRPRYRWESVAHAASQRNPCASGSPGHKTFQHADASSTDKHSCAFTDANTGAFAHGLADAAQHG